MTGRWYVRTCYTRTYFEQARRFYDACGVDGEREKGLGEEGEGGGEWGGGKG